MNIYISLFTTFFKIGLFTFGGGYAMIPIIQEETVNKHHWIKDEDILDIVAIAESTPGPIAINSATFVGYLTAGNLGSLMATMGVVLPSFMIISMISMILKQFQSLAIVQYAFWGIRAGILALIVKAMLNMYKKCDHHIFEYFIMILSFVLVAFIKVNVLYVIILDALLGLGYSMWIAKEELL